MKRSFLEMHPDVLNGLSAGVRDYVSSLQVDNDAYVKITYVKSRKHILIASVDEFVLIDDNIHKPEWKDVKISWRSTRPKEIDLKIPSKLDVFPLYSTRDLNVLADIKAIALSGETSGAYGIYKANQKDKRLNKPMKNIEALEVKLQKNSLGDWALGLGMAGCFSIPLIILGVIIFFLLSSCTSFFGGVFQDDTDYKQKCRDGLSVQYIQGDLSDSEYQKRSAGCG